MNAWEPMDAASTQLVIEKGKVEELIQQIEEANEELGAAARQAYEDIL